MKVIVKARHMVLTPALKAHAEEKLGEALMRVFDKPAAKIEIELNALGKTKDGVDQECRVTVFIPKGKPINISEVDDDMYKAIDLAHDRLLTQVKRERGKKRDVQRTTKKTQRRRNTKELSAAERLVWEKEVEAYEKSRKRA